MLEKREHVFHIRKLLFVQEDQRILEDDFHLLRVRNEVRRDEPAVELHSFHNFQRRFGRFRLFNGDDSLRSDLLIRLGHQFADRGIVVRRDRGNLRLLKPAGDGPGEALQRLHSREKPPVKASLEIDGTRPRRQVV